MASGAWSSATPHFVDVLNQLPCMDTDDYHFDIVGQLGSSDSEDEHTCRVHSRGLIDGVCDACRRRNNPASVKAIFYGRPYELPWLVRGW